MKTAETKNVSIEYNTRLPGFTSGNARYIAALDGKIKAAYTTCPRCGRSAYVENGYHAVENSLVLSLGLNIKIGQYTCKICGCHWSTSNELIDLAVQSEKEFVKSLLLGCVRSGLSFERSCALVEETAGVRYSPQYLYELYASMLDQIKHERFTSASGVYHYDEQYLKENGREICRLTIIDAVTRKVLLDKRALDAQYDTIKGAVQKALKGLPVEVFILDMNREYPNIIGELYPKAKIQWCIFHLYKLIWKELQDEFGKYTPLIQLYNVYTLFNVFFDHSIELKKLEELLKRFECYNRNSNADESKEIEHCLRKEFGTFVKDLKKQRRRTHESVPRRTLKQSENRLAKIKEQFLLYPKKLQERIRKIEKHWEKFTLFQRDSRVQPTNNGIEHYFAATLAKTDKKNFRSKTAVIRELTACQAEWNGNKIFSRTKLSQVLSIFGRLFAAFHPT